MTDIDLLKRQISEGRISRREFIQSATAAGLAAAIPAGLLAEEAKAAAPKRGGKLRQALRGGSTSDSLFAGGGGDSHNVNTSWQVMNNLTEIMPDGSVTGELAESFEASADAATWTFKLRKGVEFHNGKTLDAEDIIHSINVHRGKDTKSTGKGLVTGISDIKADGKNTVVFTLKSGNADFPAVMSDYHFPIGPAGTEGKDWDKGIGTGPYSLTAWEPGIRSAGKRNPNYFKEGKPYFDEVETLHVADVAARMSAIRSDEVDVIDEPDLKLVDRLQKSPGLAVHEAAGAKHFTYPMHMDKAPFDNLDVRLALKYAIDRKAILQTLLRGHGYLGNDHPIARNQKYYASELPQRAYDPDKAKFHLKKAGMESLDLTLYAGDIYAGGVDGAVLYKEHAAKAGINMDVKRVSTDGYWSNVWNVKPFCVSFWSGRPTEDLMFSTAFAADSAWNETKWTHERFNKLLVEARAELDEAKRRAMYVEMQQIVRDIGGLVAPVFANWVFVTRDKISVPEKIAGNWPVDGLKNTERWWFS